MCTNQTQYSKLWDHKGDVVLKAKTARFRVDSSRLFELTSLNPLMARSAELFERCPVIELHDSASEVFHFLMAFFKFGELCNIAEEAPPFLEALALAVKYEARSLMPLILDKLSFWYPTTVEAWDSYWSSDDCVWELAHETSLHYIMSFNAARILRAANALDLLPAALIRCCGRPVEHINMGYHSVNGLVCELDTENKKAVLSAFSILSAAARLIVFPSLFNAAEDGAPCQGRGCAQGLADLHSAWNLANNEGFINPVQHVFEQEWMFAEQILCEGCLDVLRTVYNAARRAIWSWLPVVFGLVSDSSVVVDEALINRIRDLRFYYFQQTVGSHV